MNLKSLLTGLILFIDKATYDNNNDVILHIDGDITVDYQ